MSGCFGGRGAFGALGSLKHDLGVKKLEEGLLDTESFLEILIHSVVRLSFSLWRLDPDIDQLALFFLLISEVDTVPNMTRIISVLVQGEFLRRVLTDFLNDVNKLKMKTS